MAQEDGGSTSAGAEERQGAGGPERRDQVPEEPGGGAGANHPLAGGRERAAQHGESDKSFIMMLCWLAEVTAMIILLLHPDKLQDERQLAWEQREVELERQLDQYEKHQNEVLSSAEKVKIEQRKGRESYFHFTLIVLDKKIFWVCFSV